MLYVHVSEENKPWIDAVVTEPKDGFDAKPGLLDSQVLALIKYPTKCWVNNNGAVMTPDNLPLSDAEQKAQQNDLIIKQLQDQVSQLTSQVNQSNSDKSALQSQIANLTEQIGKLQSAQLQQANQQAQAQEATQETK